MESKQTEASAFMTECKARLDNGRAKHHRFLLRVMDETMSREQLRIFMIHWYMIARAHRVAYPSLIANIEDDQVRFELINILHEEYGSGDRTQIHAVILQRLMDRLEISDADVEKTRPLTSTERFAHTAKEVWGTADEAFAYGLHFGLESLATSQQNYFANGMRKYSFLSERDREYFDIHTEAEVRHVKISEPSFVAYAAVLENQPLLLKGCDLAEQLLGDMWSEMERVVFNGEH